MDLAERVVGLELCRRDVRERPLGAGRHHADRLLLGEVLLRRQAGDQPESLAFVSAAGSASSRNTVCSGSTASTRTCWCAPRSARFTVTRPSLSGARLRSRPRPRRGNRDSRNRLPPRRRRPRRPARPWSSTSGSPGRPARESPPPRASWTPSRSCARPTDLRAGSAVACSRGISSRTCRSRMYLYSYADIALGHVERLGQHPPDREKAPERVDPCRRRAVLGKVRAPIT